MMAGIQVTLLVLSPHTTLIINRFSPFYSELGYIVSAVYHNSAHLSSIGTVEEGLLGRDAHLTPISEFGGVPLRFPLGVMIDVGDMLYLLSVFRSTGNSP
ncbi:MAG: hypothetical protein GY847_27795 [Proteobacteria bacterium]|nr:hypothetical protein [Pseudomonadota bacterium]